MKYMTQEDWSLAARSWVGENLQKHTQHIPVFESEGLVVKINKRKAGGHGVLSRTNLFDEELAKITDTVRLDYGKGVDGMLYCLYTIEENEPVPIYVGIARAIGHTGKLSVLFMNSRKKPRFDDYDGYHIGDLSTQIVPGYTKMKACKKVWADHMFSNAPSLNPKLCKEVYFWGKAWSTSDMSVVSNLGHTPLFLEESLLVHAFRTAYPNRLLNR